MPLVHLLVCDTCNRDTLFYCLLLFGTQLRKVRVTYTVRTSHMRRLSIKSIRYNLSPPLGVTTQLNRSPSARSQEGQLADAIAFIVQGPTFCVQTPETQTTLLPHVVLEPPPATPLLCTCHLKNMTSYNILNMSNKGMEDGAFTNLVFSRQRWYPHSFTLHTHNQPLYRQKYMNST